MKSKFLKIFFQCTILLILVSELSVTQVSIKPDNQFEIKTGWEIYRNSITGIIGYNIFQEKCWSIVPEINYVIGFTISGSVRLYFPIKRHINIYTQAGLGGTLGIMRLIPTGVFSVGIVYRCSKSISINFENRIFLLSDKGVDWSIGGNMPSSKILNVSRFPPFTISIGVIL